MSRKGKTTTDLVLDQHLYQPDEIYEKLTAMKARGIRLSQAQFDFVINHRREKNEPKQSSLPYRD